MEQQKKDAEKLRNRFNGLFKELDEYRKKNDDLEKELKILKEESSVLYKQNNFSSIEKGEDYIITKKSKKSFVRDIKKLNENVEKLKKENEYLKSTLNINNINFT